MTRRYSLSVAVVGGLGSICNQLRGLCGPAQRLKVLDLEGQFVSFDGLKAVIGISRQADTVVGHGLLRSSRTIDGGRLSGIILSGIGVLAIEEFNGGSLNVQAGSDSAILTRVAIGGNDAFNEDLAALGEILLTEIAELPPGRYAIVDGRFIAVVTHVDSNIKVTDSDNGVIAQSYLPSLGITYQIASDHGLIH